MAAIKKEFRQSNKSAQQIDWMVQAKNNIKSTKEYIKNELNISYDKWIELRFELACVYAESLAGKHYHSLVANKHYMEAFFFQYLKHDIEIASKKTIKNYSFLKHEMLNCDDFQNFIFSYINSRK